MFFKKNTRYISVDTLIGEKAHFEGNITLEGNIRIDGKVNGEIKVSGDVIIGEKAKVFGNITANNVIISGTVEGDINAKGQVRITSTGKLSGNIKMSSFIADEGSVFQGKCDIIENPYNEAVPAHHVIETEQPAD